MTITRTPLCTVDWCAHPTDPDYHTCIVCQALAVQHAHVESRSHNPSRRKDKANQVMLCVLHHQEVDLRQNGTHGHAIRQIPGRGRLYFRFDLHGNTTFQKVLPNSEAEATDGSSLEVQQASASELAAGGERSVPVEGLAPEQANPPAAPAGPGLTNDTAVGAQPGPALMDAGGEESQSVKGSPPSVDPPRVDLAAPRPSSSAFSLSDWKADGKRLMDMGLRLKGLTDEWRYDMGEWVAQGEQNLGEEAYGHFTEFESAFGTSHLRALGWVAANVSRETRQLCPSWSHARAVATLPERDQRAALITARDESLSSRELSALVRPVPPEREKHACPICGFSHWARVEESWKA